MDQLAKRGGGASPESVASGEILCGEFKLQPTTSLQQDFNFGMGHFSPGTRFMQCHALRVTFGSLRIRQMCHGQNMVSNGNPCSGFTLNP